MIELRNITKTFQSKEDSIYAVQNVSLRVEDGDVFGIVGYSGAGKSTLVRCINFLEAPDEGSIFISDFGKVTAQGKKLLYTPTQEGEAERPLTEKDLKRLRSQIGMIFQHFNLLGRATVFDNIAYPLRHTGKSREQIKERVNELLALVDLSDKAKAYPAELSGGQKQRVAIARALANNPRILLSDEATSALDPEATESILKLLKELNRKLGLTIVLITHEMAVVKSICNKVVLMEDGNVVEGGEVYEVFSNPQKAMTRRFVDMAAGLNIDKLLEEGSHMVKPKEDEVLIRCIFDRESVGDALISEVSRKFGVNMNIVLANVEILQDSPLGGMVLMMSGPRENRDDAIRYMRRCKVQVDEIDVSIGKGGA